MIFTEAYRVWYFPELPIYAWKKVFRCTYKNFFKYEKLHLLKTNPIMLYNLNEKTIIRNHNNKKLKEKIITERKR